MQLLKIDNLNKKFDDKYILKDINLTIPSGKIILSCFPQPLNSPFINSVKDIIKLCRSNPHNG